MNNEVLGYRKTGKDEYEPITQSKGYIFTAAVMHCGKCFKCGYDWSNSGDSAHVCGPVNMPRQETSNLVKMWDDPRFQLLADLDKLLEGSRVWGGMEWTYHPIHPFKYLPIKERVRKALDEVKAEYGVKE